MSEYVVVTNLEEIDQSGYTEAWIVTKKAYFPSSRVYIDAVAKYDVLLPAHEDEDVWEEKAAEALADVGFKVTGVWLKDRIWTVAVVIPTED